MTGGDLATKDTEKHKERSQGIQGMGSRLFDKLKALSLSMGKDAKTQGMGTSSNTEF